MRPIAPVGVIEFYAVPGLLRLTEQLIQTLAPVFGLEISQQPPLNEQFHEAVYIGMLRDQCPIEPTGVVVLAVSVVVAPLRAAHLVPHADHGHTEREYGTGQKILDLPVPQVLN